MDRYITQTFWQGSFQLCMQSKSFYYPVFDLFHCLNCIYESASPVGAVTQRTKKPGEDTKP